MAELDSSIYFRQQTPDIMGSISKGLSMRDMIENRNNEKALQDAYKAGMVTGPDGKMTFDGQKTMSALANSGLGQQAYQFGQKQKEQDSLEQENKFKKIQQTSDFLARASDSMKKTGGQGYDQLLAQAKQMGMDTSMMPPVYGPDAQQKLDYFYGQALTVQDQYKRQRDEKDDYFKEKQLQSAMADRQEARNERRFQAGIRMDEKEQALKTPYGMANTVDDAKQLKEAHESKANFDSKIQEMIDLRKKYGTEYWNREAVSRGKQLSKDLLLAYKNMAKLGVLSKSDEDIINAIIPDDPLGHSLGAPGQDPILTKLESFKRDSDKDFQNRINTRTRAGIDTAAKKQPLTKVINGVTYIKVEGGWLPQ